MPDARLPRHRRRLSKQRRHAAAEPLRAALLADGNGYDGGNGSQVEFIVRSDEGATLSIVQANEPGFRKGDRVVILRDDRTRLARPD